MPFVLNLARSHRLSVYDASYLELAVRQAIRVGRPLKHRMPRVECGSDSQAAWHALQHRGVRCDLTLHSDDRELLMAPPKFAVETNYAVIENHDSCAELLHVTHLVRREKASLTSEQLHGNLEKRLGTRITAKGI